MSRPRRVLTALACAAGACALTAPAALAGAPTSGHGAVLSFAGHTVRLVDKQHRVDDVHVRSTKGLRRGDVVRVRNGRAHVTGHVGKVAFLGRVVRSSGKGAVVRLGDGSTFKVGGRKSHAHGRTARSAASVTIDFQGFDPGQTLLITVATDGQGNVAITIRVLPPATDIGDGELHAAGVVTDDEGDGYFAIDDGSGGELGFEDPQRVFEGADAAWCDVVDVAYHRSGRRLIADELHVTGQSTTGDCADDGAADEVDGTVTAIAPDASSLTIAPDDGGDAATYQLDDPSLLDGIAVGDDVAVTLDQNDLAIDVELLDGSGDPAPPAPGDGGDQ
ncbi:MAG: copper-binding protein [Actinobacteria bacterium]|nr:copper-binding protein [Actinomycetota bacterium]